MKTLLRLCYWFQIRSLERQLHDQRDALRVVRTANDFTRIAIAAEETKRDLVRARAGYEATFAPGVRHTWRQA